MRIKDLRNTAEREKFISNYRDHWGYLGEVKLFSDDPMYRYYVFKDEFATIIAEEKYIAYGEYDRISHTNRLVPDWHFSNYYLLQDNYETFLNCRVSKTELINWLKERRKDELSVQ